jgi:hypothetical protein
MAGGIPWHRSCQRGFCNLQNLKAFQGFESNPLRPAESYQAHGFRLH